MSPIPGSLASTVTSSFARAGFESIATINGSGVQSVSFTSIPQNYTDLWLIISAATAAGNYQEGYPTIRYNSDSATNYSRLSFQLSSNATNSQSGSTGQDFASAGATFATNNPRAIPTNWYIFDYAATDKAKTTYSKSYRGFTTVDWSSECTVYLWNSTSAITTITLVANTANGWATYTQFSLYGVGKK